MGAGGHPIGGAKSVPRSICSAKNAKAETKKAAACQRLLLGGRTRARTWDPLIKSKSSVSA